MLRIQRQCRQIERLGLNAQLKQFEALAELEETLALCREMCDRHDLAYNHQQISDFWMQCAVDVDGLLRRRKWREISGLH